MKNQTKKNIQGIFEKKLTLKGIEKKQALAMLEQILLIRRFEERAQEMYQQRKIGGFCHLCIGQEATAVGVVAAIREDDFLVTAYRDHGYGLLLGLSPEQCMAELFGKVDGCVEGRGGSMHFFNKDRNFLGGHGIVGGQIPIGTGAAFYAKYKQSDQISITLFGDGAAAEGTFHESLNLASIWDLPCIYIIENNMYGMGTDVSRVSSIAKLFHRAQAYGMEGYEINGMDVFEVYRNMSEIVKKCRETSRPVLVEIHTYRFRGHSVSDAATYRSKEELAKYKQSDPVVITKNALEEAEWLSQEEFKAMDKKVREQVMRAIEFANESPLPDISTLQDKVYCEE